MTKITVHVTGLDQLRQRIDQTDRAGLIEWMMMETMKRFGEKSTMPMIAHAARAAYRRHLGKLKARRAVGMYFGRN
jgi:hypothetical protein